jgi:hypothetical protein
MCRTCTKTPLLEALHYSLPTPTPQASDAPDAKQGTKSTLSAQGGAPRTKLTQTEHGLPSPPKHGSRRIRLHTETGDGEGEGGGDRDGG